MTPARPDERTTPTTAPTPTCSSAHVHGDVDAFGVLFARHRDRLWAVALRTMGNPEDAADGLQDGLIAAYRRAGSFRGEAAVTTWLHRVVVNACLDRIRAAKVRRADPLPDDLDDHRDRGSLATSAPTTLPTRSSPTTGAGRCSPRWPPCRPSSGRRWCWSTWRATPSPRWPRCSTARSARSSRGAPAAGPGSPTCSGCSGPAVTRTTPTRGTRPRPRPSDPGRSVDHPLHRDPDTRPTTTAPRPTREEAPPMTDDEPRRPSSRRYAACSRTPGTTSPCRSRSSPGSTGCWPAWPRSPVRDAPVTDLATRRRRATSLLVAAAAVVAVGVGVSQVVDTGTSSAGRPPPRPTGRPRTRAGAEATPRRRSRSASPPTTVRPTRAAPPRRARPSRTPSVPPRASLTLTRKAYAQDVVRPCDCRRRRSTSCPAPSRATGRVAAAGATCLSDTWGEGTFVPVRYDGAPAVLVFRRATGDTQVADLFLCGDAEPRRSVTLPAP